MFAANYMPPFTMDILLGNLAALEVGQVIRHNFPPCLKSALSNLYKHITSSTSIPNFSTKIE